MLGVLGVFTYSMLRPGIVSVDNTQKESAEKVTEVTKPTKEEQRLADLMKIKEQEAKLEVKRDIQKEELETKSAEYESKIAALKAEYSGYVETKNSEIKATEAELASFIKATVESKN